MKFWSIKNLTAIWLFALFLNAFSVALFAAGSSKSAETVYCPLTKKLQPVKASKKEVWKNPLKEICADETEKKSFSIELFGENLLKTNFLDEKQFEDLVFDFFRKGTAAFAVLPPFPSFPRKNSIKTFSADVAFGKTGETEIVWKALTEKFNFAAHPRPPNSVPAIFFEPQTFQTLEKISRQIAPRAPPFSLS